MEDLTVPPRAFVFVSQPTALSPRQCIARDWVHDRLRRHELGPRAIGVSEFGAKNPLHEVCLLARHCSGGVILGFTQAEAADVVVKPGTASEERRALLATPSPWNQLEAGILVAMRLPLLVLCEPSISGGVFDPGAGEHYVNHMDVDRIDEPQQAKRLEASILSWANQVWSAYRAAW